MVNFNPVLRRAEESLIISGALFIASLLSYAATGLEVLLWRGTALGLAASITYFLFKPRLRGIRKGDMILVSIWREIETPLVSESFIESSPTIAMEDGRTNQKIKVKLWDGSQGVVHITGYGLLTPAEGKLIEAELPVTAPNTNNQTWSR